MDSSSSLYKIEPLSGADNYPAWKFRMEDILQAQKLWGYVTGTIPKPVAEDKPATASDMARWEDQDYIACAQIRLQVKDSILAYVRSAKSAKSAWDTLQATYESKGPLGKVLARRKLFRAKCEEGENIEEFLRKLQGYREDLASLDSIINDDEFGIIILTALADSWDTFTSALDNSALTNTVSLIACILEQDRHQRSREEGDTVLTAKGKGKSASGRWQENPNKDTRECYYCQKKGHLKKDCRKRKKKKRKGAKVLQTWLQTQVGRKNSLSLS